MYIHGVEDNNYKNIEYQSVRSEIADRVKILHNTINFCIAIIAVELIVISFAIFCDANHCPGCGHIG